MAASPLRLCFLWPSLCLSWQSPHPHPPTHALTLALIHCGCCGHNILYRFGLQYPLKCAQVHPVALLGNHRWPPHTHPHTPRLQAIVCVGSYWLSVLSKEDEKSHTEWTLSLLFISRHHTKALLSIPLLLERLYSNARFNLGVRIAGFFIPSFTADRNQTHVSALLYKADISERPCNIFFWELYSSQNATIWLAFWQN